MTRLFNLESYVECCHYARLFHEQPEQLIPHSGDLPFAYKLFLHKYATYPYLREPILSGIHPQELAIHSGSLDYLSIGTQLNQGDKQHLFIIRDTVDLMTLSMSQLLEPQQGYIYSSAYHYWNHSSQLCLYKFVKPLVFVDLDSFGCSRLIPVNFSPAENSPYQVPILNTRESILLDSGCKIIESYNIICQNIAYQILADNFPTFTENIDTFNHLASYLQRTFFFQILQPYVNQKSFNYIVEILNDEQIFYKQVTLSIDAIAQIVFRAINIQYLRKIANKYPQYQFALIAQYNIFPHIQELLPEFICLNPIFQDFPKIWQQKSNNNFPLFGIYLDEIEFAICVPDETGRGSKQWIQLSNLENATSYEGKPTVLIGRIPSINRDFFRIPQGTQTAKLPIKVNGEDYCKNGVPQDYNIQIENHPLTEDVCIHIKFHLQPGSFPQIEVTDLERKYKITASLIARKQISYCYIPPEKIFITRQQKSLTQIRRLLNNEVVEQFKACLSILAEELKNLDNNQPINYKILTDKLKNTCQLISRNKDLLQFIDSSSTDSVVSKLRNEFQNPHFKKIVGIICRLVNSHSHRALSSSQKDFLAEAIILIGKLYTFSQYLIPESLLQINLSRISQIKHRDLGNEYLQCLTRIGVNEEVQSKYFESFESYYKLENSKYLWGYGRILLWYYNFGSARELVNYRLHFAKILENLLSREASQFNEQYKQNAFLALLYLLTFRANDKNFCQHGSDEMRMAERVINSFKNDRMTLKEVSKGKPLNQLFQEMIEGTSTEDDLENLLLG